MTTIEKIGQFTIAKHGQVVMVLDHRDKDHQVFHSERQARDFVLEAVDLVDRFEATVH